MAELPHCVGLIGSGFYN